MESSDPDEEIQHVILRTVSEDRLEAAGLPKSLIKFEASQPILRSSIASEETQIVRGPWVSHSDFLIGKVALTPPFTQKHKQAVTHRGILELGGDVEATFLLKHKTDRENAVREREDFLRRLFAAKKVDLIKNFHRDEELRYEAEMHKIRLFYENKICELLWEGYEQIRVLKEQKDIVLESFNTIWEGCLEREIKDTVEKITVEFLEKLRLEEQVLVSKYSKDIKTLKKKNKFSIEFEKIKCQELLIQMKHKLHCENISNLMYLLCKERRRCKKEKIKIEDDYLAEMRKQRLIIRKKCDTITKLTNIKNKKTQDLCLKERCLIEVLRQFQKFMYFALQATYSTPGAFFMNIYKLIKAELEDYLLGLKIPQLEIKKRSKSPKIEKTRYDPDIEEFLKYSKYPVDDDEAEWTLPVFYFNKKKYIREDFNNVMTPVIDKGSEFSLWQPEVENLLNEFKKTMKDKGVQKMKSQPSTVHFEHQKEAELTSESSDSAQLQTFSPDSSIIGGVTPRQTPVTITQLSQKELEAAHQKAEDEEEKELRKISLDYKDSKSPKLSLRMSQQDDFGPRKEAQTTVRPSRIELARDSITLHDDFGPRKDAQTSGRPSRIELARDSITLTLSAIERKSLQAIAKTAKKEQDTASASIESAEIDTQRDQISRTSTDADRRVSRGMHKEKVSIARIAMVADDRGSGSVQIERPVRTSKGADRDRASTQRDDQRISQKSVEVEQVSRTSKASARDTLSGSLQREQVERLSEGGDKGRGSETLQMEQVPRTSKGADEDRVSESVEMEHVARTSKGSDGDRISESLQMDEEPRTSKDTDGERISESGGDQNARTVANKPSIVERTSRIVLASDSLDIIRSVVNVSVPEDKEPQKTEMIRHRISVATHDPGHFKVSKPVKTVKARKTLPVKKQAPPMKLQPSRPQSAVSKAKIAGWRQMKEHTKTINQFTNERMAELVHIMKKNPSVIPLFTPCPQ